MGFSHGTHKARSSRRNERKNRHSIGKWNTDIPQSPWSVEPIAKYMVIEEWPWHGRRRLPRYYAEVLTEVGHAGFGRAFKTLSAAQQFCEKNVRKWRRQIQGHMTPGRLMAMA